MKRKHTRTLLILMLILSVVMFFSPNIYISGLLIYTGNLGVFLAVAAIILLVFYGGKKRR